MGKKSQIKTSIIFIVLVLLLTSCGTVKKHAFDEAPTSDAVAAATNIPVASKIAVENTASPYTVSGLAGAVENDAVVTVYDASGKAINTCNATGSGAFQCTVETTAEIIVISATAPNKQESAKTTIGLAQL